MKKKVEEAGFLGMDRLGPIHRGSINRGPTRPVVGEDIKKMLEGIDRILDIYSEIVHSIVNPSIITSSVVKDENLVRFKDIE